MGSSPDMSKTVSEIVRRAGYRGLDLAALGSRRVYDAQVDAPHRLRGEDDWGVVLVLGNTRAIWAPFVAWLAEDEERLAAPHPLDDYVAQAVAESVTSQVAGEVHWMHERASPLLSAARLAAISGLASPGPAGLSAHEIYGPWFALRAAVVMPGEAPNPAEARAPCAGCAAPCGVALDAVLQHQARRPARLDQRGVAERWRDWLKVREACPVGQSWRYEDHALAYHYTKHREYLRALVDAHRRTTTSP